MSNTTIKLAIHCFYKKKMNKIIQLPLFLIVFLGFAQNVINKNLSVTDFKAGLDNTNNEILLDVRTPAEVSKGSIKDAKVIDFQQPNFEKELDKLDKTKPIYVYCAVGGRSGKTAKVLVQKGFKEVYNLEGGYNAWKKAKMQ
jgi:phage shock protein E